MAERKNAASLPARFSTAGTRRARAQWLLTVCQQLYVVDSCM